MSSQFTPLDWPNPTSDYKTPLGTLQRVLEQNAMGLCPKEPVEALKWVVSHFARHIDHTKLDFLLGEQLLDVTSRAPVGFRNLLAYDGLGNLARPTFVNQVPGGDVGWWVENVRTHAPTAHVGSSSVTYSYKPCPTGDLIFPGCRVQCTRYSDQANYLYHTCIQFTVGLCAHICLTSNEDGFSIFTVEGAASPFPRLEVQPRECVAAVASRGGFFDLFTYHGPANVRYHQRYHLNDTTVECFHGAVDDVQHVGWLNVNDFTSPSHLIMPDLSLLSTVDGAENVRNLVHGMEALVTISQHVPPNPPVPFGGNAATRALHTRLKRKIWRWRQQVEYRRLSDPVKNCVHLAINHAKLKLVLGGDVGGEEGDQEGGEAKRQRVE